VTGAEFSGVDIDLLADYVGGALAGTPDESAVAARIADDPQWQAAYESLSSGMAVVGAALAGLEPEPMPADLAARLEALFTSPVDAEPAAPPAPHLTLVRVDEASDDQAPGDKASGDDGRDSVRQGSVRKARPWSGRRRRWVAPVAVAAGLIAFVGFGLDYLAGLQSHTDASATSAGSGMSAEKADRGLAAPSAPGTGQILSTGTDYTAATLATDPTQPRPLATEAVPTDSPPSRKAPSVASGAAPALRRLTGPDALVACLSAIEQEKADGPISVESVDYAQFNGSPAVVVRFTTASGRWAWASGPACGTTSAGAAKLREVPVG